MTDTPLQQWLARLEQLHPKEIDLGLERIALVAERMGLLPPNARVITVAGTNGKGSTVAALEALALASGVKTGAATSPHLLHFNERIRVAGQSVQDDTIVTAFEAIEAARGDTSLTYFEFNALAALEVFRSQEVELYLLEVGLGGRLDAVNIIDADVAVITSIDLDHQQWLGSSREQIAVEKAGIARSGRPVVVGDLAPPESLREALQSRGAIAAYLGEAFQMQAKEGGLDLSLHGASGEVQSIKGISNGSLLPQNLACAAQALVLAGISLPGDAAGVLSEVTVPGRRQHVPLDAGASECVLDVAHNPAAVSALCQHLDEQPVAGRTLALFCVMADKDLHAMIALVAGRFDAWFVTNLPDQPRAVSGDELGRLLHQHGESMISVSKNPRQAWRRARSLMSGGDRLVVFGSFFTVAAVLPGLLAEMGEQ